jgi:hypothetical protein
MAEQAKRKGTPEKVYAIYDKSTGKLAAWDYRVQVFWHKYIATNALKGHEGFEVRRVAIEEVR